MRKIKENWNLILYLAIVVMLTVLLFWAIGRKEGFHEDEIFSYGASNSSLGSTFLSFARKEPIDTIIKRRNPITTLKNYVYYNFINKSSYKKEIEKIDVDWLDSIWRNSKDSTEYLQIDNWKEAIDFFDLSTARF